MLVASSARGEERFLSPDAGETLAAGSAVEVRWSSVCSSETERDSERDADEAELVLSYDGGLTFPIRVSPEISPCASHFSWRVPSIPSSRARLALRVGREERGETEKIELLSEPFAILPDPDGQPERLYARSSEWWTPQAPDLLTAEDFLEETLAGVPDRLASPVSTPDAGEPPPAPAMGRPALQSASAETVRLAAAPSASICSLASYSGAATPLRR